MTTLSVLNPESLCKMTNDYRTTCYSITYLRFYAIKYAIFELLFAFILKRVFVHNFSNENEFDCNENELTDEMHFYNNVFARRLVLTQRQRATRK